MTQLLNLGQFTTLGKATALSPLRVPAHHLTTHCFTAGASGSGKTGVTLGLVEEALRHGVPVLMIDVKGDLTNLGLSFPSFSPAPFEPWVQPTPGDPRTLAELAKTLAAERAHLLAQFEPDYPPVQALADQIEELGA